MLRDRMVDSRQQNEHVRSNLSLEEPATNGTSARPSPDVTRPTRGNAPDGEDHDMEEAPNQGDATTERAAGAVKLDIDEAAQPDATKDLPEKSVEPAEASEPRSTHTMDANTGADDVDVNARAASLPAEKEVAEHDDDHVVEGEEDTVIY